MFDIHVEDTTIKIRLTRFDAGAVESIKCSLTERRFNRQTQQWIGPLHWRNARGVAEMCERWEQAIPDDIIWFLDRHGRMMDFDFTKVHVGHPTYQFKNTHIEPLFQHQIEGFNRCVKSLEFFKMGHFLEPEMGGGKTRTMLEVFNYFWERDNTTRLLVIAPKTPMGVWGNQVDDWLEDFTQFNDVQFLVGSKEKRIELLKAGKPINVTNFDGVASKQNRQTKKETNVFLLALMEYLKQNPNTLLTIDESVAVKNPTAQRTRGVMQLAALARACFPLSGTPVTQSYLDLYSQFNAIHPDIMAFPNVHGFKNHFCVYGGFNNYELIGYQNTDELKRITKRHSFRILKKDCLDLPEKIFTTVPVEMSKEQARHYTELKKEHATLVDGQIVNAPIMLTRLLRFQQITSGFLPIQNEDGETTEVKTFSNAKLEALEDMLKDMVLDSGHKVSIVCRFHHDLDLIGATLRKLDIKFIEVSGRTKTAERLNIDKRFDGDDSIRVALLQEQAAKEGLTLVSCHQVIFYSLTFSLNDYMQIQDRFHRPGQKFNVNYWALICKGTVDAGVFQTLKRKFEPADFLVTYGEAGLNDIINGRQEGQDNEPRKLCG